MQHEEREGKMYVGKDKMLKSWKSRWVIGTGSTLFLFSNKENYIPDAILQLNQHTIEDAKDIKSDKKHVIVLSSTDSKKSRVLIAVDNEDEKKGWYEFITRNLKTPPAAAAPDNPHAKGKGMKYAFENSMASSSVGQKIIKQVVDDQTWKVIDELTSFLKETKGEEISKKFKHDLIKGGTKIAILYHNKMIADQMIIDWYSMMVKLSTTVVDSYQMPSLFAPEYIIEILNALKTSLEGALTKKLKPKNLAILMALYEITCDEPLIENLFTKGKWPQLPVIAKILDDKAKARAQLAQQNH